MTKLLHYSILLAVLSFATIGNAQSQQLPSNFSIGEDAKVFGLHTKISRADLLSKKKVFSHNLQCDSEDGHDHDHSHIEKLSFIDIISADQEADFNCSGGFCMNTKHYHKKGLTLNKQLFIYFLSISC